VTAPLPPPAAARASSRWFWLAALMVFAATLGWRPLFNPDEGRYAEIPREMLASGDFVVPRLNDLVYLEKPPLQYWLTAAAFRVFGIHPFTARLVPALAALAGIGIVYFLARRLWGASRAETAALMAGSMLLYVFMAELLTLDMLLSIELLAAIALFCASQLERERAPGLAGRLILGCWIAMAAATLTKGLIGLAIPGAILVLYTLVSRDIAVWRHLALLRGGALYALLVVPWFAAVEAAHPGALRFLIIHEHFERYLTKVHARYQPVWYFLPILAIGVLPWLPQVVRALATGWRRGAPVGRFDAPRVLWIAAVFILAFFSISDSKLAPYILPVLPLAALLGSGDGPAATSDLRRAALLSASLGALLLAVLACYPVLDAHPRNLAIVRSAGPWIGIAAALVLAAGVAVIVRRPAAMQGVRWLAGGHFAAALLLATAGAGSLAWKYSGSVVLPELAAGLARAPRAPLYAFRTYDWTLPVYTGRVLIPVEWRGELDYGLGHEPDKGISAYADFDRRWRGESQAFALVEPPELSTLAANGLPFVLLKASPELVLISRFQP
jgi:4-amino-4-deoxy-L-arabinose transferase-like glycosyltransferase